MIEKIAVTKQSSELNIGKTKEKVRKRVYSKEQEKENNGEVMMAFNTTCRAFEITKLNA